MSTTEHLEGLLDIQEVAELLKIPVRTLRAWRQQSRGPRSFKIGKHVRYRPEDVRDWIAGRSAA